MSRWWPNWSTQTCRECTWNIIDVSRGCTSWHSLMVVAVRGTLAARIAQMAFSLNLSDPAPSPPRPAWTPTWTVTQSCKSRWTPRMPRSKRTSMTWRRSTTPTSRETHARSWNWSIRKNSNAFKQLTRYWAILKRKRSTISSTPPWWETCKYTTQPARHMDKREIGPKMVAIRRSRRGPTTQRVTRGETMPIIRVKTGKAHPKHQETLTGQGRNHSGEVAALDRATALTLTVDTGTRARHTVRQATDSTSTSQRTTSYSSLAWVLLASSAWSPWRWQMAWHGNTATQTSWQPAPITGTTRKDWCRAWPTISEWTLWDRSRTEWAATTLHRLANPTSRTMISSSNFSATPRSRKVVPKRGLSSRNNLPRKKRKRNKNSFWNNKKCKSKKKKSNSISGRAELIKFRRSITFSIVSNARRRNSFKAKSANSKQNWWNMSFSKTSQGTSKWKLVKGVTRQLRLVVLCKAALQCRRKQKRKWCGWDPSEPRPSSTQATLDRPILEWITHSIKVMMKMTRSTIDGQQFIWAPSLQHTVRESSQVAAPPESRKAKRAENQSQQIASSLRQSAFMSTRAVTASRLGKATEKWSRRDKSESKKLSKKLCPERANTFSRGTSKLASASDYSPSKMK